MFTKSLYRFCYILAVCTAILLAAAQAATPAGTIISAASIRISVASQLITENSIPQKIVILPVRGIAVAPSTSLRVTSNTGEVLLVQQVTNLGNVSQAIYVGIKANFWSSAPMLLMVSPGATVTVTLDIKSALPHTEQFYVTTSINVLAVAYVGLNGVSYGGGAIVTRNVFIAVPDAYTGVGLNLRCLLQGYYRPGVGQITTNILVELRTQPDVPGAARDLVVGTDGWTQYKQFNAPTSSYYIYIRHANHTPVITNVPVNLAVQTTINITDPASPYFVSIFKSAAAQNVTTALRAESDGRLVIRGGDYNHDGVINIVDWSAFDYEWKMGGVGADFNGDGSIDTRDYGIWLSNNQCYLPIK